MSLAQSDLDKALSQHHATVLDSGFGRFSSLIFEFAEFPVLCTTGHMPSNDWHGNIVQDLTDKNLEADWITAASFYSAERAWVVFTWLETAKKVSRYVESLIEAWPRAISDALIKYFFSISENVVVDPVWWYGLEERQRAALNLRIIDGLPIGGGVNITAPKKREPIVAHQSPLAIIRL